MTTPSPAWSLDVHDAFAQWDGQVLTIGNGHIQRRYGVVDGLPQGLSCSADGKEWIAAPLAGPSVLPPGRSASAQPAQVSGTLASLGPIGAPALCVDWRGGGHHLRFTVLPQIAAVGCQLWRHGAMATVPDQSHATPAAAEASGVEEGDAAQLSAEGLPRNDRCEAFFFKPLHLRLREVAFQDRTDLHDELVQIREWLLHPNEALLRLRGILFVFDDVVEGGHLALLKEAPLPTVRPVACPADLMLSGTTACAYHPRDEQSPPLRPSVALYGHGVAGDQRNEGDETVADGYRWWSLAGASEAELRDHLQRLQRAFAHGAKRPAGLIMSNTWGDRSRDAALNGPFMEAEIDAAAAMGVDVVQIDDGWQQGVTANSVAATAQVGVWEGFHAADQQFWSVNRQRFPDGLPPLIARATQQGMQFGLWFAPDSADDFAHWAKDAQTIVDLHRQLGVCFIKIDGVKARTRLGEQRLRRFFDAVLVATGGALQFDLDVTAEVRPGYWGMVDVGCIFVENRYSDSHRWWPHHTWRNAWQLARWIDPARLRMEFLNPLRNQHLYDDDPLAPNAWPFGSVVAMSLPFSPLAWMEVSRLPVELRDQAAELIICWKALRPRWLAGVIHPLSHQPNGPDGMGVSAMASISEQGLIIVAIRGLGGDSSLALPINDWQPNLPPGSAFCHHGHGHASIADNILTITVSKRRSHAILEYLWTTA